jgi:two-component system sensor histidine kinase KdpD
MELVDIGPLAKQLAKLYTDQSPERRILAEGSVGSAEVMADPELLRMALSQLVENACKYSALGSTVTIETVREAGFITARVSNNGSTIPSSERYRIFERFYRGSAASNTTSGTGLGLYIARKIALAHGGALALEPGDPAGDSVTFCLKIPMAKEVRTNVLAAK